MEGTDNGRLIKIKTEDEASRQREGAEINDTVYTYIRLMLNSQHHSSLLLCYTTLEYGEARKIQP
jgi:hypothetical protein